MLLLMVAGCDEREGPGDDTLVVAFDGAPSGIDPGQLTTAYAVGVVQATYETLYEYRYNTQPLELVPSLAEGWPTISDGGKTLTVRIRNDSKFADSDLFSGGNGRYVVAQDVVDSILRHFDQLSPAKSGWLWRDQIVGISDWNGDYQKPPVGIQATDTHTIQFRLVRPSPHFLHTLATAYSSVVPSEAKRLDLSLRTVGSGPYEVKSIDSLRAILNKNSNYSARSLSLETIEVSTAEVDRRTNDATDWNAAPFIKNVRIEFIEDPVSRWVSFDNEEIHITSLPDEFVSSMFTDEDARIFKPEFVNRVSLHSYIANEVLFIRFRMDDSSIGYSEDAGRNENNRMLRCAIADSIDWHQMNNAFFGADAVVYWGVIPPTLPDFDEEQGDLGKALNTVTDAVMVFEAAGHNLPELSYGLGPSSLARQNFDLVKSMLISSGYPPDKVTAVRYSSFGALMQGAAEGKHILTQMSWALDIADAADPLQLFYGPNASPGANIGNYLNPKFDDLYREAFESKSSRDRSEMINDMQDLLRFDCPYSGTLTRERIIASSNKIDGVPNHDVASIGRYFKYMDFKE